MTAVTVSTNGHRPARDVRGEARRAWLEAADAGAPLSGAELARRFDRSPQWGRQIAAEAREAQRPASGRQSGATGAPVAAATPAVAPPRDRQAPASEPVAPPGASPAVRRTTAAAVALVALVAAAASYSHMHALALVAGEAEAMARLLPLSVDGLVVAASMTLLASHRGGRRAGVLPWLALLLGLGASLAANVAAAEPTVVGRLVAAWPPVALALSFELLLRQTRR